MQTIPIFELPSRTFSISFSEIFRQAPPKWTTLTMKHRRLDGFVYVEQGAIRYRFGNGKDVVVSSHGLIYLPCGSSYQSEIIEEPFSLVRLSYVLTDLETLDQIRFSEEPQLITDDAREIEGLIEALFVSQEHSEKGFHSIALLSTFLDWARHFFKTKSKNRLTPAVVYLQSHFKEQFSVEDLATLCHISTPQFYRLFRAEYGETPLEYRDRLRLSEAKHLLRTKEHSVSEVAELTGFESIYYFSRFFKKHEKKTPGKYQASLPLSESEDSAREI